MIHNIAELREQAERCRRLAKTQTNKDVAAKLQDIASQFDEMADVLKRTLVKAEALIVLTDQGPTLHQSVTAAQFHRSSLYPDGSELDRFSVI